jgi:hypothetical protein
MRLSIPGTLAATLLKSDEIQPALARLNSAPAPPLACAGVMESAFVRLADKLRTGNLHELVADSISRVELLLILDQRNL